jgi:hypothetical protein
MTCTHQGMLYSLPLSEDNAKYALPGQFVFPHNDSDFIAGFIYDVDHTEMLLKIVVFDPVPLPEGAVLIKDNLHMDDIEPMLREACDKNPDMYGEWAKLIYGEQDGLEG